MTSKETNRPDSSHVLRPPTGPAAHNSRTDASTGDDVLAARLAALTKRQPTTSAGARQPGARQHGTGRSAPRRRHAAQHSRVAALTLSVLTTGGLGYYFAAIDHPAAATDTATAAGVVQSPTAPTVPPATTTPSPSSTALGTTATTTPNTTATPTTTASNVVVNGQTFTNRWGPVQVQATFAPDGSLLGVDATQTPNSKSESVSINARAVPRLNSEALTAQSAHVDTVSGATYTSMSYQQSLQSAIDIAVASGVPAGASA